MITSTFLERLMSEQEELANKFEKLARFIDTPKFDDVSPRQQQLLILQYHTMTLYNTILKQRIDDLNVN